jgi:MYXO-CTERM domain-containing protein
MEIPVERLPPGSTLPLIGLDFFPGEALQIQLTGPAGATDIGIVKAGPDGHFEAFLAVPVDAVAGPYTVDAISQSGIIIRALVTIDPLAPPASYEPVFPTAAERSPPPEVDLVPFAAAGLALLGLGVLFLRTRRSTAAR